VKKFAAVVGVLLLAGVAGAAWLWYGITQPYQRFSSEGVFVTVPRGASSRGVARLLHSNGVIRNPIAFEIYARRHARRTLQAGEYFFDKPISGRDVFWKVAKGQVYVIPFTVREGETMYDIAQDLEAQHFLAGDDFIKAASDPTLIRNISPHAQTLEGFLFPATYQLTRHPAANELTAAMVKKFKEEWARISPSAPGDDPAGLASGIPVSSIVTMASLVERETPKPDERPLVAGVFENRLHRNMLLQCDPTVIYGLQQEGQYNGTLTGNDLHLDSPYNTYVHAGLPPGPIGNPGEISLRAALQPAQTDYLYFVANTQGGHFFSATLEEHNRNVTKYRRLLAGLPADPPPPPPKPKPTTVSKKTAVKKKAHTAKAKSHKGTSG
jgi:UPF0755 protein